MVMLAFAAWLVACLPTSSAFVFPSASSATQLHYNAPSVMQSHQTGHIRRVTLRNAAAANNHDYLFDDLKTVETRLENLERESPDILSAFYEPVSLYSFIHDVGLSHYLLFCIVSYLHLCKYTATVFHHSTSNHSR